MDFTRLSLICLEQNQGAMRLYSRLGFREIDRRPLVPIRLGGRAKATPYCLQSWRIQIGAHLCAILRSLTHALQRFSDQQFSLLSPFARHRFC